MRGRVRYHLVARAIGGGTQRLRWGQNWMERRATLTQRAVRKARMGGGRVVYTDTLKNEKEEGRNPQDGDKGS